MRRSVLFFALLSLLCCRPEEPRQYGSADLGEPVELNDGAPAEDPDAGNPGAPDSAAAADATVGEPDVAQPATDTAQPTEDAPPAEPDGGADVPTVPDGPAPPMTVATWNLRNFSPYGASDFRLDDIADRIATLDADVLGVQELKVADGTQGAPPQAWDELLDTLPEYAGIHAPWDFYDSTVGLLYRKDTVVLLGSKTIFPDDWYAFPRPPLVVTLAVEREGLSVTFHVIVLHLKAYDDSADRRHEACLKLDAWMRAQPDKEFVVVGDLNDSPHDAAQDNIFLDNFLGHEPRYVFVTSAFQPGTVTSIGWFHYVDGKYVKGQLIDHIIVTGGLHSRYESVTPKVFSVPANQYNWWGDTYSDHFPVLVDFR